ncbi:hypothetical protein RHMOL_Rhmol01G0208000 [Rhododendron molle]|uniref:Uncharacterized protein n=1 Tax=Rhododendron molle TaxID=49168 RepID=A0ACC0Q3Y3_RHOML|nr:hypothetical protein RHMOL_Rhmol01G0208000 [Rhododendron molle]
MAPPKKKTKGNVVDVDCRNEELKEMDEEYRNEVPKHPRNAWIFFYQEQCKLKDDVSLKSMSMEEISEKWKALGDHARQKYKKKSIKSSEKYKEDKIKLDLPKVLKFSSAEGRIGLVLDLIMFEGNNVKDKIMEKAKKKYPSPKGKN